ncbi:MAG: hypothetical protein JNN32_13430 [Flavobacteriales bacterium]|nr:hypothetical protein [Flavobacteriales bacterium]
MNNRTNWIHSAALDVPFILAPPFVVLAIVWACPGSFGATAEFREWHWVALVLLIDVAHVYSTIYRTYLDPLARQYYRRELTWYPLIAFVVMVLLHSFNTLWFWRVLAYLAVFHFVRQQYGFMRLYQRGASPPEWKRRMDGITIYAATIAPLLHWHTSYPKRFNWFMPNDMLGVDLPGTARVVLWVHAVLLLAYVLSEIMMVRRGSLLNWPKNVLVAGTAISWYMGIVHFNGDVTFTLFNVVAHGVPYMALVWAYGRKRTMKDAQAHRTIRSIFSLGALPIFLGSLFILAFLEEGFWDALVWREDRWFFQAFYDHLPVVNDHALLSIIVPLLALPQVTHYIIDAFIWRMRKGGDRDGWQSLIFGVPAEQAGKGS